MGSYSLIMDYIVETVATVRQLTSPNAAEEFNRAPLLMTKEQIIDLLKILNKENLIELSSENEGSENKMKDKSGDLSLLHVWLTAKGGKAWESERCPNWEKYIAVSSSFDLSGAEIVEVEAIQKEALNKIWENFKETSECMEMVKLSPWNATYWKHFCQGYKLTFKSPEGAVGKLSRDEYSSIFCAYGPWVHWNHPTGSR